MEDVEVEYQKYSKEWRDEQIALRSNLIEFDDFDFEFQTRESKLPSSKRALRYIGGVDLSFAHNSKTQACAALVVLEYPSLKLLHEEYEMVELRHPYIAGFLAFREVPHLLPLLNKLRKKRPEIMPQVIFVDGNGVLHFRGFGIASHLGVVSGIPCIGVAKTLLYVDGFTNENVAEMAAGKLNKAGDFVDMKGASGRVWGTMLRPSDDAVVPVFVSVGHRFSLASATALTILVSRERIPEPIRRADLGSREVVAKFERSQRGANRRLLKLQQLATPHITHHRQQAQQLLVAHNQALDVQRTKEEAQRESARLQEEQKKAVELSLKRQDIGYSCPVCWNSFEVCRQFAAHKHWSGHCCARCVPCDVVIISRSALKRHSGTAGTHYYSGEIIPNKMCRTSVLLESEKKKSTLAAAKAARQASTTVIRPTTSPFAISMSDSGSDPSATAQVSVSTRLYTIQQQSEEQAEAANAAFQQQQTFLMSLFKSKR